MRYKTLITQKLEQLQNNIVVLNSLLSQGASRYQVDEWFEKIREKVEEVQTLVNSENQD